MVAYVTRVTRSGMLKALSEDYVRTARAKGLPSRLVVWRHALRNVLIPVVTVIGLYLGVLIGNAVLDRDRLQPAGPGQAHRDGAEPARLRAAAGPHGGHRARHRRRQHPDRPDLWSRRSAGEDRMSAIARNRHRACPRRHRGTVGLAARDALGRARGRRRARRRDGADCAPRAVDLALSIRTSRTCS